MRRSDEVPGFWRNSAFSYLSLKFTIISCPLIGPCSLLGFSLMVDFSEYKQQQNSACPGSQCFNLECAATCRAFWVTVTNFAATCSVPWL
ncbi:hypothetical protein LX36DRAFT_655599 [Colletotrichum falcatum]|nr:hypothetical protein LX36DRAFT_655599 [Colletotrichum falcatum]